MGWGRTIQHFFPQPFPLSGVKNHNELMLYTGVQKTEEQQKFEFHFCLYLASNICMRMELELYL